MQSYLVQFQWVRMFLGGRWWLIWSDEKQDLVWTREPVVGVEPEEDWE